MVGIGYDIHKISARRALILGGVRISDRNGLLGHSDADVVLHAVIDAILGAKGLGDIGDHFPDSNPSYKGISSVKLLENILQIAGKMKIINVDINIIIDSPKLCSKKKLISKKLAKLLRIKENLVNVKAKTSEGTMKKTVICQAIIQLK